MAVESSNFNKQYEKIALANQELANVEGVDLMLNAKETYKLTNNTSTELLQYLAKKDKDHYDSGGSLNSDFRKVAQKVPSNIYKELVKISNIKSKTQNDRDKKTDLYARLETWKRERLADKTNVKMVVGAITSDLINYELMNPEYKTLLAQVINRDGDLNEKGIKLFNRKSDDKLMIQYTPNRMGSEYNYNKKMEGIDLGIQQQGLPEVISFEELITGAHHKQLDAETIVYDTVVGQAEEAALMNKDNKTFKTASWALGANAGRSKVMKALMPVIKGRRVIADLATRDIFGKGSTYRDDLSGLVDRMDLSKMGIVDKGKPGYEDDLANDAFLKEEIIGRLINPKSSDDEKFAEEQMLEYFTLLAEQSFNNKRNEITGQPIVMQDLSEPSTFRLLKDEELTKRITKPKSELAQELIEKYSK